MEVGGGGGGGGVGNLDNLNPIVQHGLFLRVEIHVYLVLSQNLQMS